MLLELRTMGCGRSKPESTQQNGREIDALTADITVPKKKRLKGDKKENKDPNNSSVVKSPSNTKKSPGDVKKSSAQLKPLAKLLGPPSVSVNGMSHMMHFDVDIPIVKDRPPPDTLSKSPKHKDREFTGKHVKVTSSQLDFFKMLDDKIEQGDDYMSQGGDFRSELNRKFSA